MGQTVAVLQTMQDKAGRVEASAGAAADALLTEGDAPASDQPLHFRSQISVAAPTQDELDEVEAPSGAAYDAALFVEQQYQKSR